jgi:hypothetical protein
MKAAARLAAVGFATLLVATFVVAIGLANPSFAIGAGNSPDKTIVGSWEGTMSVGTAEMPIKMELRADGKKIIGDLKTPHGPWPITDAKYADGKWNIEVQTPEKGTGSMKAVLSGEKLEGHYDFPPSFAGDFKFTRVKATN